MTNPLTLYWQNLTSKNITQIPKRLPKKRVMIKH